MDTGSADLFLDTKLRPMSGFKDTGINGSVGYLYVSRIPCGGAFLIMLFNTRDGSGASGHIILANVSIGEFTIPQQALSKNVSSLQRGVL